MSFPIAVQSAVFYILACTPCAKVRHRHKAKVQAKKEREEKMKLHMEQPELYRHPSPFNTNPYWQEEISIGPSLPKKTGSKNSSQRGLTSSGRDSDAPSVSERTNTGDSGTNFGDSPPGLAGPMEEEDHHWNRRHGYQREDEELWGQWPGHKLKDAFSKARNSAGRLIETKMGLEKEVTDQERRDFYFAPKNPPVNDYHPPVVSSKIPNRNAHQWMLQPPPSAKVMEGKIPVGRAVSTGSRSSGVTLPSKEDVRLSRVCTEKLMKERVMKENNPTEAELIESLFVTRSYRSYSLRRSRSLSLDDAAESIEIEFEGRRGNKFRPIAVPPGLISDDDSEPPTPKPRPVSHIGHTGHALQRPKLQTIISTEPDLVAAKASKLKVQRPTRLRAQSTGDSPVGDDTD